MKKHLTYAESHRLFSYEPASGLLTRKIRTSNCIKAGDVVGTNKGDGYLQTKVNGKLHLVHRIAFLMMTGAFPEAEVDHINGVKNDNRWCNLREASRAENCWNTKMKSNNASGYKGVSWEKRDRKWKAQIMLHGTTYYLGYYTSPEDAAQAYNGAAAIVYGEWCRS